MIIKKRIVPDKLMSCSTLYYITITNPKFIINEYEICVGNNKKIEKIKLLEGKHPNCDPQTNEFCIPDFIKKLEIDDKVLEIIENMFKIFNFESSFYQPWADFEIKKI